MERAGAGEESTVGQRRDDKAGGTAEILESVLQRSVCMVNSDVRFALGMVAELHLP